MSMKPETLFNRYYYDRTDFVNGTKLFHSRIAENLPDHAEILDVGAGPSNETSRFLALLGRVTGLDVGEEVKANDALSAAFLYNGLEFPFSEASFDVCVSDYVLEHVEEPELHFQQVYRVLKPGGRYHLRTPNMFHYIPLITRFTPQWFHVAVANRLRRHPEGTHDPWPTVFRANSMSTLRKLADVAGFRSLEAVRVECEPSYARAHPALFYPMMAYERWVNRVPGFSRFRINIFATFVK